jgi:hypothetical protein
LPIFDCRLPIETSSAFRDHRSTRKDQVGTACWLTAERRGLIAFLQSKIGNHQSPIKKAVSIQPHRTVKDSGGTTGTPPAIADFRLPIEDGNAKFENGNSSRRPAGPPGRL